MSNIITDKNQYSTPIIVQLPTIRITLDNIYKVLYRLYNVYVFSGNLVVSYYLYIQ